MTAVRLRVTMMAAMCLQCIAPAVALPDPPLGPNDIFATVDGTPIEVGEIDLLLRQRFGPDLTSKPAGVSVERLRRATAAMLVRRQLAMRSLQSIGGQSLEASLRQARRDAASTLAGRGVDLDQRAAAMGTTAKAMIRSADWQTAWSKYIRSTLTDDNLRSYYRRNRDRYAGQTYEEVTQPRRLRSDATAALFDRLVERSSDAGVIWYVESLRPPERVSVR